ncbi:HD domain-containing phosphohydrolase [Desulfovibrio ferrophilus]|uniref:Response regulator receiver modulated metal dependent phosphohydrolase n=1 Tax=Desulfovibrio ferrophilus TaxID=241368 RepID=A0A2Z6AZJ6_9BACT|nr:HD domain-containing phosphohydrolase [Desulfovibrio ferrophilus]BBD08672.1 response regulator receiver modulated metal dependent phosphohydrolase [Desulfovibrio ferrophilus]
MADKILFVDDDQKILSSVRRLLEGRFELHTAGGGDEGLQVLHEKGPFAVIVSDIKMPGMDGLEFLARSRDVSPDSVRMVLTGYANLENAVDAVNSGYVFRFLAKPCSGENLDNAIAAALAQFTMLRDRAEMQTLRRLKDAMEGIITGFVNLVEARDPYTAGHQRSVTLLSVAIAESMGLEPDRIRGLRFASSVHDIGKVYVPAEFLNRPGRLTDVEFAIIKTHPQVGFDILDPVDFPWPVSTIVHQHHERLDGTGYPLGLSGDDILLEARIMAVADVVDAISSHRPYRPGHGVAKALQEVESKAGDFYDADAVAVCLDLFRNEKFTLDFKAGEGPRCEWLRCE